MDSPIHISLLSFVLLAATAAGHAQTSFWRQTSGPQSAHVMVLAVKSNDLVFAGYDQEQWVMIQHYEDEDWPALIQLWKSYNDHLAHVIAHIPAAVLQQRRWPHTLDRIAWQTVSADKPATLEYLIRDYIGHLNDHAKQILSALEQA